MRTRAALACVAAALAAATLAASAHAHVVYGKTTLREWIVRSDLAVVAHFERGAQLVRAADGSSSEEVFRIRVEEVIRAADPVGAPATGQSLEFFAHTEGFPAFRAGDRALVFLERTSDRPEFRALAPRFAWHSLQTPGAEWKLEGAGAGAVLDTARRWAALRSGATPSSPDAIRSYLAGQLDSSAPALRRDAIAELVRLRQLDEFFPTPTSVAPFARRVDEPTRPMSERIALLHVLGGAPGFDASARLRALTRQSYGERDLRRLVRVSASSRDPALGDWLATLLRDPRPAVRLEAASALGRPWRVAQRAPLEVAAHDPSPPVARAARRSLVQIDDPD